MLAGLPFGKVQTLTLVVTLSGAVQDAAEIGAYEADVQGEAEDDAFTAARDNIEAYRLGCEVWALPLWGKVHIDGTAANEIGIDANAGAMAACRAVGPTT